MVSREQVEPVLSRVLTKNVPFIVCKELEINKLTVEEYPDKSGCLVSFVTAFTYNDNTVDLIPYFHEGQGLVDALLKGLIQSLKGEFPSLEGLRLSHFSVVAKMDTKKTWIGSEAKVTTVIGVANGHGAVIDFEATSRSVMGSIASVVSQAILFFSRAEAAFRALREAISDAQARNRQDLVAKFTSDLATIVRCTNYEDL